MTAGGDRGSSVGWGARYSEAEAGGGGGSALIPHGRSEPTRSKLIEKRTFVRILIERDGMVGAGREQEPAVQLGGHIQPGRIERMVGGDRSSMADTPAPARSSFSLAWGEQAQRYRPARMPSPLR